MRTFLKHITCLSFQNGNVTCARASCPPANCPHPMLDVCGCPTCGGKDEAPVQDYVNEEETIQR